MMDDNGGRYLREVEPFRTHPIVIGLGGLKESGKDTVADHLVAEHGFVKIGMSDPLLEAMKAMNPWILLERNLWAGQSLYPQGSWVKFRVILETVGYTKAKEFREVRVWLQGFGGKVVRDILGKQTWVNIATKRIDAILSSGKSVAVTGIRYANEIHMIDGFAVGQSWWVDRGLEATDPDPSENSVTAANFSVHIPNHSTLERLYQIVDMAIARTERTAA